MKKCEKCGVINKESDAFCANCGSFLQGNAPVNTNIIESSAPNNNVVSPTNQNDLGQTQVLNDVVNNTNQNVQTYNPTQQIIENNNLDMTNDYSNIQLNPNNNQVGVQQNQIGASVAAPVTPSIDNQAQPEQNYSYNSNINDNKINYDPLGVSNPFSIPENQVVDNGKGNKNNKVLIIVLASVLLLIVIAIIYMLVIKPLFLDNSGSNNNNNPQPVEVSTKTGRIGDKSNGFVTVTNKYKETVSDDKVVYSFEDEVITLGHSSISVSQELNKYKEMYDEGYSMTLSNLGTYNAYVIKGTISSKQALASFFELNGITYYLLIEADEESNPVFDITSTYSLNE
jgi:hypothetical protein